MGKFARIAFALIYHQNLGPIGKIVGGNISNEDMCSTFPSFSLLFLLVLFSPFLSFPMFLVANRSSSILKIFIFSH